jgi:class 3 adenylate cyclase
MMRRPRSLKVLRGGRRMTAFMLLLVAACLSGGCVLNGDFDRIRPELVSENMHDWVGRDATVATGGVISEFRTTDQERELRDRAYALIEPPYNRGRWDSVLREYGFMNDPVYPKPFVVSEYLVKLHKVYRRSEASAYAQIETDARNDVERLGPFFWTAQRVTEMDKRREQSLALVSDLNPRERGNAIARNRENAAVIGWVCVALKLRLASYRYALERLVIAVPSQGAAAPKSAAEIALSLVEGTRASDELSDVRVGLAFGPVLEREGDLYGPVVNLASRVTVIALPGTVVVGPEVAALLEHDPAYTLRAMRPRYLKNIGRTRLFALRRAEPVEGRFAQRRQALREATRARVDPEP